MKYKIIARLKPEYRLGGRYAGESIIVSGQQNAVNKGIELKDKGIYDVKIITNY